MPATSTSSAAIPVDVIAASLEPDEIAFAESVRAFCRSVAPTLSPMQYFSGRGGATRELYQLLGSRDWLSMSWPTQHGGGGRSVIYDFLLWNELAYWRLSRPDLGPGIIAHIIITHGTPEQCTKYLPGIAAGTEGYALGYSEPDAGSDLAGLRTRAELDGDEYIINGEKIWTSDAHNARYIWLLARTGPPDSRGRGLTLLICPTDAPGVEIYPIETMDGHRLNRVGLHEVRLPAAARIGVENGAWNHIRDALAVERHLQLLPGRPTRDLEDLVSACEQLGILDDGATAATLLPLILDLQMVTASALAAVDDMVRGGSAVLEASRTRLIGSRLVQAIPRAALQLLGAHAVGHGSSLEFLWRESIMETIAGGSSEMLESIIARQSLGLGS